MKNLFSYFVTSLLISFSFGLCAQKNNIELSTSKERAEYNKRFDSIMIAKVESLLLNQRLTKSVLEKGSKYLYTFKNEQDLYSEFAVDDIFLPFYFGLFSEEYLFEILNGEMSTLKWESIIHYLKIYDVPNIQDKEGFYKLIQEHLPERFKMETEYRIYSNLYWKDQKVLRVLMDKISNDQSLEFLYNERGKYDLLNIILYRYIQNGIDDFAISILNILIEKQNEGIFNFGPTYFVKNPLDGFLFFDSGSGSSSLAFMYENGSLDLREKIKSSCRQLPESCITANLDLKEVNTFEKSIQDLGLTDFVIDYKHKVDVTNTWGTDIHPLHMLQIGNKAIRYSELFYS